MNSLWSGTGFANGAFHSQNMTFGYIVGRALAGVSESVAAAPTGTAR